MTAGLALTSDSVERSADCRQRRSPFPRLRGKAAARECGGNLAEAARRAQVKNRNTLISPLKKHGLR
jgi:transcriptional regulator of acetoin/glycerol metabolism